MNAATFYRAIYMTLFRMNEHHWRYRVVTPANSNTPGGEAA